MTKALQTIVAVIGFCIALPIWFYLLHTLLVAAHVDRRVGFLFWMYVPMSLLAAALSKVIEAIKR